MKTVLIASLCVPLVAAAQSASTSGRWSFEAATGVTTSSGGPTTQAVGAALSFLADRALTPRVSLRFAADWGSIRSRDPVCSSEAPCTKGYGMVMSALSVGITAARSRLDAGLYGTARMGAYMLGTEPGVQPGGYLGVGLAAPARFGAFTFEVGVHGHLAESKPRWIMPVRVGLRLRP